jgi:hypothetical protein
VSVANANATNPALEVYGSDNYWGGAAPVVSNTAGTLTDVYIPTGSNVSFTSTGFLADDPQP